MSHEFEMLWARFEVCARRVRRAHTLGVAAPYAWADHQKVKRELDSFVRGFPQFEDEYEARIQALNRK